MRNLIVLVCLALCITGCCSAPTFTDATNDVVNKNAEAWDRIHTLATLTLPEGEVDGKTRAQWLGYIVAAEANALVLQAKAAGAKLTYAEAKAKAEEVTLP